MPEKIDIEREANKIAFSFRVLGSEGDARLAEAVAALCRRIRDESLLRSAGCKCEVPLYDTEFIEDSKTIDLISIGVVCEDGRTYYAVSTEFNPRKASQWVKDNVLIHLPERNVNLSDPSISPRIKSESLAWKSRTFIREDLLKFIVAPASEKIELWGYYADYDHVVLCQLFGTMMDLPKGWPMWTHDIKQLCVSLGDPKLPKQGEGEHNALADALWNKQAYEFLVSKER